MWKAAGREDDAVKSSDGSFVSVANEGKLDGIALARGRYNKKITTNYVLHNIEFGLTVPLNL